MSTSNFLSHPRNRLYGHHTLFLVLGTAFGLGFSPFAPGTCGALLGVGIFIGIATLAPAWVHIPLIAAALTGTCLVTIALSPWAEQYWECKDPKNFVLDEVAGFLLTVLLYHHGSLWQIVIWSFLATRFFDILKPFPARRLEYLPAGWGVLLDDLVTSLYAVFFLYALSAASQIFGVKV